MIVCYKKLWKLLIDKNMKKKDRILYVLKYLQQNVDEDHLATVADILDALADEDIKVEHHELASDIEQLIVFGIDIVCEKFSKEVFYRTAFF